MLKKIRGFTLIELLIVVAIIGILAALLIPNAITAIQKAKQKSTMKDMTSISTAIADYITDNGVAPTNPGEMDTGDPILGELASFYIKILPINDSWGKPFWIYCGTDVAGNYNIQASDVGYDDFLVTSRARKNGLEGFNFVPSDPGSGLFIVNRMSDFERDLVQWAGSWIRAPKISQRTS